MSRSHPSPLPFNVLSSPARRVAMATLLLGCPLAAQAQDDVAQSDTVVVTATALKVATPLVETPRAVSTVQREELEERNVQSLDETLRYRSGVLSGQYGADNNTDWLKIRGFDQATYQDGLRIYRTGYYQWLPEPYGLDRVEVFKGPASILYGEAPSGGLINAVSKRPTAEKRGEIEIQAGNRNHRQFGVDTSGPVTESGDMRYRFVGLYKERDGDLEGTDNERVYFAPSLEWDISDDTQLTVLASYQKDDGVPVNPFKTPYGTVQDTPFGKVDPETNYGAPDYDKDEHTQTAIGYEFKHQLDDTWKFEQDFRYSHLDLDLRSTYILSRIDERTATRGHLQRDGDIDSFTIDNRMMGKWYTERTENTLLLGVDYQNLSLDGKEYDSEFSGYDTVDIFDPQGDIAAVPDDQLKRRRIDKEQLGLYVQDQLRIDDRWVLLGAVRYDQAETDNADRTADTTERADDNQVSWSGGVMYLGNQGINPYLSYTESFEPQTSVDDGGNLYEPLEGEQWELGVKVAPPGWDGYFTVAVFDLEQRNSLVASSSGGRQEQSGKQTSQGVELEGVSYLTNQLQLTAAYTYTDAEGENGERKDLIPRHQASAWLDYDFEGTALDGLKAGAGVRYVGESSGGSTITVPDYTVADAMASYDFNSHWTAQVNVNNVTDEEYVASCEADFYCYYGESRSVIGSLKYRW
ncbi:TonB-dependent siderophore receptor [Chromohalobacter sp. TMW 2.2308]|uniref:TonB-dependent siderophore receptor n=1 Tax=Chromohalobacter TaxID=42054 RepID=UPI001FFCA45F|nr:MULTISPECIES: TonB-dependent siderophore receptor [Chromohalobacter]MCK2041595.1 TonB-dependent siderophore receptor [Chromohalobacter moromii]MCT8513743.1 TonB-dependent siderophore receptor [Chromohalobacter sp. TMW 2.2271]